MKKCTILLALTFAVIYPSFSQAFAPIVPSTPRDTSPIFMIETSGGYAIGVDLDSAAFFGARLVFPFRRFGLAIEAGSMFLHDNSYGHVFFGPLIYVVNNSQWRVPISLGFDMIVKGDGNRLGIGGSVSVHRMLTSRFYAGANLGISYAFSHRYSREVFRGYRTGNILVDDGTGNAVFVEVTAPVYETENRNVFGNRFHFRPSLLIGMQF